MKAADYVRQYDALRGHFYAVVGRDLWSVLWAVDVVGVGEEARLHLSFNWATRYRGGGTVRMRSEAEVAREVLDLARTLRLAFLRWSEEGYPSFVPPHWARLGDVLDVKKLYEARYFPGHPLPKNVRRSA